MKCGWSCVLTTSNVLFHPRHECTFHKAQTWDLIRLNLIFVSPKDAIYQWILDCDITWIRKMSMKLAVFIRYCQCRVKVYSFKNCLRIFYTQDYIKQNILWALLWRMFFNKLDSDNKLLILVVKWREKYSHYY